MDTHEQTHASQRPTMMFIGSLWVGCTGSDLQVDEGEDLPGETDGRCKAFAASRSRSAKDTSASACESNPNPCYKQSEPRYAIQETTRQMFWGPSYSPASTASLDIA
jgi:hypothetical protein